jgi:CRP-like cAMP-binding protein
MTAAYDVAITKFPLFAGFTPHGAQALLQAGSLKELNPGDVVFNETDAADGALLVLDGRLEVFVRRDGLDLSLKSCGPGEIVGELAVLCGIPRSASVRAAEKSVALVWPAAAFRRILLGDPFLSQRVFREALRTLIEKEQSLITSLTGGRA